MCRRCAAPCPEHLAKAGHCPRCRGVRYAFDGALALGKYDGPLRRAVLKTKHARHESLAVDLGRQLGIALRHQWANDEEFRVRLDAPTPSSRLLVASVPMFWLQRAYRGANGAERMAAGVAEILGLQFSPGTLVCRRFLQKQSELKPAERRRNVREAFRTSRWQSIAGCRILLIDDVLTTGATAHEAARALKRAGASEVYVAAVARGTGQSLAK
jgi:predicted amidophosphoribosyltransferase